MDNHLIEQKLDDKIIRLNTAYGASLKVTSTMEHALLDKLLAWLELI